MSRRLVTRAVSPSAWDRPEWLTEAEQATCAGARRREMVAARAAAKALLLEYLNVDANTASARQIEWNADERGQPYPRLDDSLQTRIDVPIGDVSVSWSHTEELVTLLIARCT